MLEALDDASKKVSMPNPDYATWVARDQFVQGWLNNSISLDILAYVLDAKTTAETWAIISAMFKSASKAKVSHLRTALNNTKKKEMTAEQISPRCPVYALSLRQLGNILMMNR
jgi:hypothetical protein